MKFLELAKTFDELEAISGRTEITKKLAHLLKTASWQEAAIICYISLGELRPPYEGTQFNLAEKSLIKVVSDLLGYTQEEIKKELAKISDLGQLIGNYNWHPKEDLSIIDVYKELETLENISGGKSQEEKAAVVKKLLKDLDPISAKYVLRIILGKIRIGFSDMTIIDALSWMQEGDKSLRHKLEDAYNRCADIGYIAKILKKDGIEAIEKMGCIVGIPIRPAAAERLPTAEAIVEKLGDCIAQPKLDGFRLQIHVDKTKSKPMVKFFSRNLKDMSDMFPDLVDAVLQLNVETLICEGEAVAYDPNTGQFEPFQITVKRKRKHDIEEMAVDLPLKVFIFDLLYLNGREYLADTHEERRTKLLSIFKSVKDDKIQAIDEVKIKTGQQLLDYFNSMIGQGLEGVVVKRPDAIYTPGKRNFNWIKLKRQEKGHLEDTLDCVVLGYYYGKGKRASFGIGAFLVGIYNDRQDAFETVAKIGTGLKDQEWKELKKKCDSISIGKRPHNVECSKELYPDVWVNPEIVCQIRADEITRSPLHTADKTEKHLGLALRFPRIMGYRSDKSAFDATTAKELTRLFEDQKKK